MITTEVTVASDVEAPVEQGQTLGELLVKVDGVTQQSIPIVASQPVERLTVPGIFGQLLQRLFMAR